MKRNIALITALCVAMLSIAPMPSSAAPDKDALMLSVTLDSVHNHHFQVLIPVTVGKPFKIVSDNGDVTNTISGTIGVPAKGVYPAPIKIIEKSDKRGSAGNEMAYNLKLDQPYTSGVINGTVSMYAVELTSISEWSFTGRSKP